MKMLVSMVLTMGILLFGAHYAMKGGIPGIPGLPGAGSNNGPKGLSQMGNPTVDEDVTVYTWTDEQGVTHFGSTPPTNQGAYEKKEILANTNVVQALKPGEEEEEKPAQGGKVAHISKVYSPEGVKDLMQETSDLQQQLNERMAEQDKMLQDIMGGKK